MVPAGRRGPVGIRPGLLLAPLELRQRVVERGLVAAAGGLPWFILPWRLPPVGILTAVPAFCHLLKGGPMAVGVRLARRHSDGLRGEFLRRLCLGDRDLLLMFLVRRIGLPDLLHAPLLRGYGLLDLLNALLHGLGFLNALLSVLGLLQLPRALLGVVRRAPVVIRPAISGFSGFVRIGRRNDDVANRAHPALPVRHKMAGDGNTPGAEQYGRTREPQPCPKGTSSTTLTHDTRPGPTPMPQRPVR